MQYSDRENRISNSVNHPIKDRLILLIFKIDQLFADRNKLKDKMIFDFLNLF